ncbi:putative lipid II flippase FtsW [Elusimicrobiota bacterium]
MYRRGLYKRPDTLLLVITLLLSLIGLVMVFSSSAIMAGERFNNMYFFAVRQFMWMALGIIALVIGLYVDHRIWAKHSFFFIALTLFLLIIIYIPWIGYSVGGAKRWIRLGGISFQPAEFAKIAVVIYLSSVLDRKYSKLNSFYRNILPPLLLIIGMTLLIYKQPDFGTSVIILLIVVSVLFVGGINLKHLLIGGVIILPIMIMGLLSKAYRIKRLLSFLNPFENIHDSGFQLVHSIVALGDGGIFGVGLGAGSQKLFFIPEVHTDFVFAIIGQELGFIGTISILVLFMLLTWRGIRIGLRHKEYLGKIMAAGLTFLISIQAMLNIGVVVGCLPTKGLALPFVGFGGSSLIFNMFAVGIILNISRS